MISGKLCAKEHELEVDIIFAFKKHSNAPKFPLLDMFPREKNRCPNKNLYNSPQMKQSTSVWADGLINTLWDIPTMDYYLATKTNDVFTCCKIDEL